LAQKGGGDPNSWEPPGRNRKGAKLSAEAPGRGGRCAGSATGCCQVRGAARGPRHAHLDGFDLHANVWAGP